MSIQDINKAIQNPTWIARLSNDDVLSLLRKYPYCASLHLISSKILHLQNSPDYQTQLAHTAAYANDRKALFRLIYESGSIKDSGSSIGSKDFNENFANEFSSIVNINADTDISRKALDAQTESTLEDEQIDNMNSAESHSLEGLEAQHIENLLDDLNTELNLLSESGSGEIDIQHQHINEDNEEELVDEHLDPEMVSNSNLIHEVGEVELNEELKTEEIELFSAAMASVENVTDSNPIAFAEEPLIETTSAIEIEERIEELSKSKTESIEENISISIASTSKEPLPDKTSFTGWLKKFSSDTSSRLLAPPNKTSQRTNESLTERNHHKSEKLQTEIKPDTEIIDELSNQYQEEQAMVYFKETEEDLNQIIKEEIKTIDEFVQTQPESKRFNGELEVSVAELAKRSLDDSQEILTETMARIYAAQGKFKKAIDILEKLELLHPEKRLYFAALIEEFKKQNY